MKPTTCTDAQTGALSWQYDTGYKVLSSPVVSNGVLYIGTEHNDLVAINAASGDLVFNTHLNPNIQSSITGTSSPMVANLGGQDFVFVGSDDAYLYKVYGAYCDSAGQVAGKYPDISEEEWGEGQWPERHPVESSPSYRDGYVYFGRSDPLGGPVCAVDAGDLSEEWSLGVGNEIRTTPALSSAGVYIGDETGSFIYRLLLGGSSSETEWNMLGHVFASQALTASLVYVGTDGYLDEQGIRHNAYLQARDLLNFNEGPGNKLRDASGNPLNLGAKIGSSPAIAYTPDGATWRRWVFITARNDTLQLHAFSSRL